jgi:ATP-dependent Lon protease
MESGVRNLEREIGTLVRKALTKLLKNPKTKSITIKPKDLEEYLGVRKYKYGLAEDQDQIGACTGTCLYRSGRRFTHH